MVRSFLLLPLALAFLGTVHGSSLRFLLQGSVSETPTISGCSVVINEIVHKPEDIGDVKGMDFVELYNPCDAEADLAGWSLTDEDETTFVMGQDGCSHVVSAGGYLVLFRNNPCSFEFGYTGVDRATLRNADGVEVMVVEWGKDDANQGRSWSAIPDGSGSFQDGRPTPGVANEAYVE